MIRAPRRPRIPKLQARVPRPGWKPPFPLSLDRCQMRSNGFPSSQPAPAGSNPVIDLVVLGALSVAAVALLSVGLGHRAGVQVHPAAPEIGQLTLTALLCAVLLLAGATVLQVIRLAQRNAKTTSTENARLVQRLAGAESIIGAEPQVLVYWEPGQPLSVVTHALTTVPGLPEGQRDLLRFGQ